MTDKWGFLVIYVSLFWRYSVCLDVILWYSLLYILYFFSFYDKKKRRKNINKIYIGTSRNLDIYLSSVIGDVGPAACPLKAVWRLLHVAVTVTEF
jgi:Ca2+/Na+ antiporter